MLVDSNKKEEEIVPPTGKPEKEEQDILSQIEEVKKNSVPKEEYEKLKKELNGVYTRVLNGEKITAEKEKVVEDDYAEMSQLRKELYGPKVKESNMSNLDYWKKTLRLRELCIKNKQGDPFCAANFNKAGIKKEDQDTANQIAECMQAMVDASDGDPEVFNGYYRSKRYIVDNPEFVVPKK